MTSQDLIARSVSHTEVAYADWSPELAAELEDACEGHVTGGRYADGTEVAEYWGTTPAGAEWRVHLRRAE